MVLAPASELFLYYGQDEAARPRYDINIISREILSVIPADAQLGPEEVLRAGNWWEVPVPSGATQYFFWVILAAVAGGLLFVIAKLLPAEPIKNNS